MTATAPRDSALGHLLAPLDLGELPALDRPFHIGDRPDHCRGLFDLEALLAAVRRGEALEPDATKIGGLAAAYDRGAAVEVAGLERADERIGAYVHALKRELGHAGDVTATAALAPPGAVERHAHPAPAAHLQIEGRSRWRVDGEQLVLEPGDLLCMPPGATWERQALERSLTLTLGFVAVTPWQLLADVLAALTESSPEWRRGLPAAPAAGPGTPEPVRRFLADRLVELAGLVRTLDPEGGPLAAAWQAAVGAVPVADPWRKDDAD